MLMPALVIFSLVFLFMTGCLTIFLLYLLRGDLSPRIATIKIKNRLSNKPPILLPSFRDAPYRRLTDQPPRHHPLLLNLQTSEGTGQACHPDITYIPEGFGTRRWRYWMVCTPYPYANFAYENPEIFASHDGINWIVPEGVRNPLVPCPKGPRDYNSDPDMFFLDGKLWLYYRETRSVSGQKENRIYLTKSTNGADWIPPVEVMMARGVEALLMSPSVVQKDSGFRMWTVDRTAAGLQIMQRQSTDGVKWSAPVPCGVVGLQEREPWHLDVICEEERLSALLVSLKAIPDWRLHYAYSVDEGSTWNVEPLLFEPAYEFEEAVQYRATMLKTGSNPPTYRIWYSASNRRNMFSIAHQEVSRENGKLEPVSYSGQDTSEPVTISAGGAQTVGKW
jgi:hypothetical protein